jgi:hypothetical protein
MGGGGKKIAPGKSSRKCGKRAAVAPTQLVTMHGMVFDTVVDNAGVGRLRQTAWGSDGRAQSEAAVLAIEAGVDRKERQFCILQPMYDGKGWKHKNVGTYPEFIPEELEGVLPEDDYEKTAQELNVKAEGLAAKLLEIVVTRVLVSVCSLSLFVPLLIALPRIQYEPPPSNATDLAGRDWSAELNSEGQNSTNITCINCVPENKVAVVLLHEPMMLEDWIILGCFGAAFVAVQVGVQIWSRVRQNAAWKDHRCDLCLHASHSSLSVGDHV